MMSLLVLLLGLRQSGNHSSVQPATSVSLAGAGCFCFSAFWDYVENQRFLLSLWKRNRLGLTAKSTNLDVSIFFSSYSTSFIHEDVTLNFVVVVVVLKQCVRNLVSLINTCSRMHTYGHAHTLTHTHKASLIEFIGEWMLTRPLQVG